MEKPSLYHEIIQPSKEILQMIFRGLNQVFHPDEQENTGAAPMLDRELYDQNYQPQLPFADGGRWDDMGRY